MRLSLGLLCTNEFALAIALTVFVIIAVILSALLISLAASKNFRTVFFREKSRKKKSAKKPAASEPAQIMPHDGVDTVPIDPPKPRKATARKVTDDVPEFLNAIPTVPLGGIPQSSPSPRGGKARQSMRIADIPDEEQGGTYTANMITITRARQAIAKASGKSDKANKTDKAGAKNERTPQKR